MSENFPDWFRTKVVTLSDNNIRFGCFFSNKHVSVVSDTWYQVSGELCIIEIFPFEIEEGPLFHLGNWSSCWRMIKNDALFPIIIQSIYDCTSWCNIQNHGHQNFTQMKWTFKYRDLDEGLRLNHWDWTHSKIGPVSSSLWHSQRPVILDAFTKSSSSNLVVFFTIKIHVGRYFCYFRTFTHFAPNFRGRPFLLLISIKFRLNWNKKIVYRTNLETKGTIVRHFDFIVHPTVHVNTRLFSRVRSLLNS